ncbi:MAG: tripartite tricarboxylate transporter substrate binding protein [Burkholderiaceae bacterium]
MRLGSTSGSLRWLERTLWVGAILFPLLGWTQDYPKRAITLIVPFAPGGGTDSVARDLAKSLSEKLGQSVVVDNRGGGGGAIGALALAKAAPDGYTLMLATSTFLTHAAVESALPYDVSKDFASVAMLGRGPLLVVVSKDLGVKNIGQLLDVAARRPQGLDYCSAGTGSINHMAGELFRQKTKANLTHVPYKGSGPATLDLIAGRVQLFIATVPSILPLVKDGRVEALAITSTQRSKLFPDLPTVNESGVPGFQISTWWGVVAPAKTPVTLINQINAAVNDAASNPQFRNRLLNEGADVVRASPAEFDQFLGEELAMWRNVVKGAQLKLKE